jgi:hypothetical protein
MLRVSSHRKSKGAARHRAVAHKPSTLPETNTPRCDRAYSNRSEHWPLLGYPAFAPLTTGRCHLGCPPGFKRHEADAAGRAHYDVNFDPAHGKLFVHLVNSMPETANEEAADTQRRIESAKSYRINAIRRGLEGRAKRIARQKH